MKLTDSLVLMERYSACPECGNGYIGNGEGAVEVKGETFYRSCKCGWSIKTGSDGVVVVDGKKGEGK